jgi:predicted nucleotidyltransferase
MIQATKRSTCLRLFGSTVRGDAMPDSDLDVLCVFLNDDRPDTAELEQELRMRFNAPISISYYSARRVEEMFLTGHLFAWHLYGESRPLDPTDTTDFVTDLGKPATYVAAVKEVKELINVLREIRGQIIQRPLNIAYEAGLMYLCLRNIAMSASWYSSLNFSRRVPYLLGPPFPKLRIDEPQYHVYAACRIAGTRGGIPPSLDTDVVLRDYDLAMDWATALIDVLVNYEKTALC